jgi:hypothetical protein
VLTADAEGHLRSVGQDLEAHRKKQQATHPKLTVTDMYNVLDRLRADEPLNAKEKVTYDQGLVGVLKDLHDRIDAAVFDAYGWPQDLTDEQILERLVALNHERAAEERRGIVRWLRPEYQVPLLQRPPAEKAEGPADEEEDDADEQAEQKPKETKAKKRSWPDALPAQHAVIEEALTQEGSGTAATLAGLFTKAKAADVAEILDVLCLYGRAEKVDHECYVSVG